MKFLKSAKAYCETVRSVRKLNKQAVDNLLDRLYRTVPKSDFLKRFSDITAQIGKYGLLSDDAIPFIDAIYTGEISWEDAKALILTYSYIG